ncbi:MAG: DUF4388 domain-containing protein [Prochloraceae cyanobacterium]|nr:DUF4388 domain-containing protein [Prochloraceae cyanobacterium]
MNITSSLETFSLLELFQLIDSGNKSGKLIINLPLEARGPDGQSTFGLWFDKGRLMAITNNSEHSDLIASIENRGWLKRRVIEKLEDLCPPGIPLGTHLRKMGVLKTEQLQLLFQIKLEQIYHIFELPSDTLNIQISFVKITNPTELPWLEMTGIRMRARQIALFALRKVKKWENIAGTAKLPEENSVLERIVSQPEFQLDPLELYIWKRANGTTTIETIAKQLHQSLANVQRAAFRLVVAGVIKELSPSQAKIRASMRRKPILSFFSYTFKSIEKKVESQPAVWLQSIGFTLMLFLLAV